MRSKTFFLLSCSLCLLIGCGKVDPESEQSSFTMENLANEPALNVVTDNPQIGDERDFMRIVKYGASSWEDYQSGEVTIRPEESYVVLVCCHNAAALALGEAGNVQCPVLSVSCPESLKSGEVGTLAAVFSYGTEDVAICGSQIELTAAKDVQITRAYAIPQENPPVGVYWTDPEFSAWHEARCTIMYSEDTIVQMFILDDIAPGYENMRYYFLRFDTE